MMILSGGEDKNTWLKEVLRWRCAGVQDRV